MKFAADLNAVQAAFQFGSTGRLGFITHHRRHTLDRTLAICFDCECQWIEGRGVVAFVEIADEREGN